MNDKKEVEIYGAEIKIWMENGVFEFQINEDSPMWVMKSFRSFLSEYLRDNASKVDPL